VPTFVRLELIKLACDRPLQVKLAFRDVWTTDMLRTALLRATGFLLSKTQNRRILAVQGIRPHHVRLWLHSPDPHVSAERSVPSATPTWRNRLRVTWCFASTSLKSLEGLLLAVPTIAFDAIGTQRKSVIPSCVKRFDLSKFLQRRSFEGQHLDDFGIRVGLDADALRASLLDPRPRRQGR
jgi:hypothetical protein